MLIAIILAIIVVALFLITVVTLLAQIWSRINTILGVVGGVVEKTEVLEPVINEIKAGIQGGEAALADSAQRLQARKGYTEPAPAFDDERDREPAGIGSAADVAPPPSAFRMY
jgi:hypothetical protein